MNQNRKYLGMTMTQIGILAGLAAMACLLFGVTGWFIFGGGFSLSRAPKNTPAVQPTATSVITATLPAATETPTPVPYEQLIPDGWDQHSTALVELWLPPGYKNARPNSVTIIAGDSVVLEMALTGSASSSSLYKLFVTVSYEPLTVDSLDGFLDKRLANIPPDLNMAERRKVFVNSTEMRRMVFEGRSKGVFVNDLMYVLQDGGTVWYLKYSAEINEFYEMLPTFEESVRTFRVAR